MRTATTTRQPTSPGEPVKDAGALGPTCTRCKGRPEGPRGRLARQPISSPRPAFRFGAANGHRPAAPMRSKAAFLATHGPQGPRQPPCRFVPHPPRAAVTAPAWPLGLVTAALGPAAPTSPAVPTLPQYAGCAAPSARSGGRARVAADRRGHWWPPPLGASRSARLGSLARAPHAGLALLRRFVPHPLRLAHARRPPRAPRAPSGDRPPQVRPSPAPGVPSGRFTARGCRSVRAPSWDGGGQDRPRARARSARR